jgi:ethanolamine ammonia-lyase large subunit
MIAFIIEVSKEDFMSFVLCIVSKEAIMSDLVIEKKLAVIPNAGTTIGLTVGLVSKASKGEPIDSCLSVYRQAYTGSLRRKCKPLVRSLWTGA